MFWKQNQARLENRRKYSAKVVARGRTLTTLLDTLRFLPCALGVNTAWDRIFDHHWPTRYAVISQLIFGVLVGLFAGWVDYETSQSFLDSGKGLPAPTPSAT